MVAAAQEMADLEPGAEAAAERVVKVDGETGAAAHEMADLEQEA